MIKFQCIKPLCIAVILTTGFVTITKGADDIKGGKSPRGHFKITDLENEPVSIVDSTGHVLATLMTDDDDRTNVSFHCVWSPDESRVAFLMYYGAKMCEFHIYAQQKSGKFKEVNWKEPNLRSYYKNVPADGIPEYAIGKWKDSTHLRVIIGALTQSDDPRKHFLLDYELEVSPAQVQTKSIKRLGILSDDKEQALVAPLTN